VEADVFGAMLSAAGMMLQPHILLYLLLGAVIGVLIAFIGQD
jgi:hypothetical protein